MHWRRTEPLQSVGGFIIVGHGAQETLARILAGKSALFHALPVAYGEDWAVLFAAPVEGLVEPVLPRAPDAVALYEAASGWWLPVGMLLDAPPHLHATLWASLLEPSGATPPAVVLPRLADGAMATREADVFPVHDLRPFRETYADAGNR